MALDYVVVELDKARKLRYDLNAVCEIEEQLNVPISQLGDLEANARNIRLLLWAGLVWDDPELTVASVGKMVSFVRFGYVCDKVNEAMSQGLGRAEGKARKTQKKRAGTGKLQDA